MTIPDFKALESVVLLLRTDSGLSNSFRGYIEKCIVDRFLQADPQQDLNRLHELAGEAADEFVRLLTR